MVNCDSVYMNSIYLNGGTQFRVEDANKLTVSGSNIGSSQVYFTNKNDSVYLLNNIFNAGGWDYVVHSENIDSVLNVFNFSGNSFSGLIYFNDDSHIYNGLISYNNFNNGFGQQTFGYTSNLTIDTNFMTTSRGFRFWRKATDLSFTRNSVQVGTTLDTWSDQGLSLIHI